MSDCLFCRIIKKEIPSKSAYEDEHIYAFHDINPQAPTHVLIVPKTHLDGVAQLGVKDTEIAGRLIVQAKRLADSLGLKSYRLVFNSGAEAGQSVFHIHLHLLGGRRMTWPPG
ncbi:MAG: histidine triad nucleotide-binding protein [Candidatus Omnitrophica bacterium]|nr:histidine triad nucleotide-binding protein [Candidatus Omnitrophota bacterium]